MNKLCFRKNIRNIILCSASLALVTAIGSLFILAGSESLALKGIFLMVLVDTAFAIWLLISVYELVRYSKKCKGMTPSVATVFNWHMEESYSRRGTPPASISIMQDGKEYFSPEYFSCTEAQQMVGKQISYVIIDDVVLLFTVVDPFKSGAVIPSFGLVQKCFNCGVACGFCINT